MSRRWRPPWWSTIWPPAAPGLDPDGHQIDDLLELLPAERPVRPGPGDEAEQLVLGQAFVAPRRHLRHDLLSEDVEGLLGRVERIEASPLDRGQQRRALDQLVPGGRVDDPAGDTGAVVVGPSHPLEEGGDAVG